MFVFQCRFHAECGSGQPRQPGQRRPLLQRLLAGHELSDAQSASDFSGNIPALTDISPNTGATVQGRRWPATAQSHSKRTRLRGRRQVTPTPTATLSPTATPTATPTALPTGDFRQPRRSSVPPGASTGVTAAPVAAGAACWAWMAGDVVFAGIAGANSRRRTSTSSERLSKADDLRHRLREETAIV